MPKASDEVLAYWGGDCDEQPAIVHLLARGYTMRAGVISKPGNLTVSERDLMAIALLCEEWDFGYAGQPAIVHLLARGYTMRAGVISKPGNLTASERDLMAIALLCEEWDFGYAG